MSFKVVIVLSVVLLAANAKRLSGFRIRPAQDEEIFEDEWCLDDPSRTEMYFDDCNLFYGCDDFNRWTLFSCPEETPIFDSLLFECGWLS